MQQENWRSSSQNSNRLFILYQHNRSEPQPPEPGFWAIASCDVKVQPTACMEQTSQSFRERAAAWEQPGSHNYFSPWDSGEGRCGKEPVHVRRRASRIAPSFCHTAVPIRRYQGWVAACYTHHHLPAILALSLFFSWCSRREKTESYCGAESTSYQISAGRCPRPGTRGCLPVPPDGCSCGTQA